MFNFYAYDQRPFMYCLYFICERKFYARTHVNIYVTLEIKPKREAFVCVVTAVRWMWDYSKDGKMTMHVLIFSFPQNIIYQLPLKYPAFR